MTQHNTELTSTILILAPFANSATCSPFHSLSPVSSSGGVTFHIRTVPSLLPVAMWWYDLPQEGAHERLVSGDVVLEFEVAAGAELDVAVGDGVRCRRE